MQPYLDLDIRDWLARYLAGEIPLGALQEWFVPVAWNVEQSGNRAAEELAYEIELHLAEFSEGHWTEEELRGLLRPLVETYSFDLAVSQRASSSSEVTRPPVRYSSVLAGIRFATASA